MSGLLGHKHSTYFRLSCSLSFQPSKVAPSNNLKPRDSFSYSSNLLEFQYNQEENWMFQHPPCDRLQTVPLFFYTVALLSAERNVYTLNWQWRLLSFKFSRSRQESKRYVVLFLYFCSRWFALKPVGAFVSKTAKVARQHCKFLECFCLNFRLNCSISGVVH